MNVNVKMAILMIGLSRKPRQKLVALINAHKIILLKLRMANVYVKKTLFRKNIIVKRPY